MARNSIAKNALWAAAGTPAMAQELKDVRGPVALPLNLPVWIALAVLLAALIAWLIGRYYRRFLRSRRISAVSARPDPWQIALDKLEELRQADLPGRGMIKEYYIRLSAIVRWYIEERFSIRAPEMTTEEFLDSLRGSSVLNQNQKQALNEFLTCCDMVKFARYASNRPEMEKSFGLAQKLIEETRLAVEPKSAVKT